MTELDILPFKDKWPWRGGDLQTLRNTVLGDDTDLSPWPVEQLVIDTNDGSGDRLMASAHMPANSTKASIVLIHGLTGCEDSYYIRRSAHYFLDLGYPVIRLNMRGAGPARKYADQEYHSGRSEDLDALAAGLDPRWTQNGLVAFGFSLGGNILLKLMGERGADAPFNLAASISAPLDLGHASRRFAQARNKLYHRWMLRQMKTWVRHNNLDHTALARIDDATSMYDFDDRYIAWRYGFTSADDYHQSCSALAFIGDIHRPVLAIHAVNDPWIPAHAYQQAAHRQNQALTINMVGGGGHLGFHERSIPGTWHDRRLLAFLQEHGL